MTYRDILKECETHIKDKDGCKFTECSKCKCFPIQTKNLKLDKRLCDIFTNALGLSPDDFVRNYSTEPVFPEPFDWFDEEIDNE